MTSATRFSARAGNEDKKERNSTTATRTIIGLPTCPSRRTIAGPNGAGQWDLKGPRHPPHSKSLYFAGIPAPQVRYDGTIGAPCLKLAIYVEAVCLFGRPVLAG